MTAPNTGSEPRHVPVLPVEVLHLLHPQPGQTLVDATVGTAGHARLLAERLLEAAPSTTSPQHKGQGRLIAMDWDPTMLELAGEELRGFPITLVHANFERLRDVMDELGIDVADAVLADLGFCSVQMERAERGFSFQQPGPLDMRLNPTQGEPASALVQRLNERELADLFWQFGEERFSRRIARAIVETRRRTPVLRTDQLAELVRRWVPRPRGHPPRIDPATRVFQALRIAVNDELGSLRRFLAVLPGCVKPGGRVAIISFHSLEDRLVKHAFREKEIWNVLTRKPATAGEDEVRHNPRARSAKLRAAIRK